MEIPLSTQVKSIFEKALAEGKTIIHFEPWSSCYSVNFDNNLAFDSIGINGNALKNAINANRKVYSFNQKSSSFVVGASKESPYITIMNLKLKEKIK